MAVLLVAVVWACNDPQRLDADRAAALVAPHAEHFARVERWVRRTLSADAAFGDRAALEETLFAPFRRDPEVVAAWVVPADEEPLVLHGPAEPPVERWVALRDPRLGAVRVGRAEATKSHGAWVVLARRLPQGARLFVAYRDDDGG